MKKLFLLFTVISIISTSFAQVNNHVKGKAFGGSLFLIDFKSASDLRTSGIVNTIENKKFLSFSHTNPGLAFNYLQGLTNHMDFAASLGGSFFNYPNDKIVSDKQTRLYLEATANVNLKLLSDNYWVTPFIDLGVGASKYGKNYAAMLPVGLGLQLNISDDAFLIVNSQYRIPVTERASYHFYHSIGVAGTISKKKEIMIPLPPVPVITDRDGDGVVDSLDRCPDVAGLAALQGCPDRDGDGIADIDDKCPDVPGLAKYQGCPIPDTDGDGINDEVDKCPNVPGVARYQGCPIPDTDGDGVNDEVDKCPNEAGPATNFGCPVIDVIVIERVNKAAKNIFFATGSSKLLAKSYNSLKDVAAIMKEHPNYKIAVDGHTDNVGADEMNQKLSEDRASSVKQYLIGNGVDESRITSTGYGETKPIVDNKTAANRALNRRVEMTLTNY